MAFAGKGRAQHRRSTRRLGPRSEDRLWTVTLHYHQWVAALAEAAAGEQGDRADTAALRTGTLELFDTHPDVVAYERAAGDERVL